jgi:hypothetical protein
VAACTASPLGVGANILLCCDWKHSFLLAPFILAPNLNQQLRTLSPAQKTFLAYQIVPSSFYNAPQTYSVVGSFTHCLAPFLYFSCRHQGCSNAACPHCRHSSAPRCSSQLRPKYVSGELLLASCGVSPEARLVPVQQQQQGAAVGQLLLPGWQLQVRASARGMIRIALPLKWTACQKHVYAASNMLCCFCQWLYAVLLAAFNDPACSRALCCIQHLLAQSTATTYTAALPLASATTVCWLRQTSCSPLQPHLCWLCCLCTPAGAAVGQQGL